MSDLDGIEATADGDLASRGIISVLEQLLDQSIHLRDLYKSARWQTTDLQYRRLHRLLEGSYKEQLELVDVLADRIRTLGGSRAIFARQFLQGTRFACALRGEKRLNRLLRELLDAHESVLNVAKPNGVSIDREWTRDFAVGQVVLTNEAQCASIGDQLAGSDPRVKIVRERNCPALDEAQ